MSTPQFILFSIIRIKSVNNHSRWVKRQQSSTLAFPRSLEHGGRRLRLAGTLRFLRHRFPLPSRHPTQHDIPVIAGTRAAERYRAESGKPSRLAFVMEPAMLP